jgi:hypothetical protein
MTSRSRSSGGAYSPRWLRAGRAEGLAREAVAMGEQTDWLSQHADALLDLADVQKLAGDRAYAANAAEKAVRLYERKGDLVSAVRAARSCALSAAVAVVESASQQDYSSSADKKRCLSDRCFAADKSKKRPSCITRLASPGAVRHLDLEVRRPLRRRAASALQPV